MFSAGSRDPRSGCTVESPPQSVENTLGVAAGRLPIGNRLATCPTILRRVFIPIGGPQAHEDSPGLAAPLNSRVSGKCERCTHKVRAPQKGLQRAARAALFAISFAQSATLSSKPTLFS